MTKLRSVAITVDWCHICGLVIPDSVTSRTHGLFGTVDHVIPRSKGGRNILTNRRAAHRLCNMVKGNKPLEALDRVGLQGVVKGMLDRNGTLVTRRMLAAARLRIGANPNSNAGKGRNYRKPISIQAWDNEGGFTGNRTARYDETA